MIASQTLCHAYVIRSTKDNEFEAAGPLKNHRPDVNTIKVSKRFGVLVLGGIIENKKSD